MTIPSLSHFSSMGYWHTGVPNGGEPLGWLGRVADGAYDHDAHRATSSSTSAPASRRRCGPATTSHSSSTTHAVFAASRLRRLKNRRSKACDQLTRRTILRSSSWPQQPTNAVESSQFVREAAAGYSTPIDYGIGGLSAQLRRVAALINAEMPTRLYYVSYQGNSFDTHVHQAAPHARLLAYTADPVRGFVEDLKRIGRADDVAIMMFTEFGRRVEENASLGTDHGTATPMFVIGAWCEGWACTAGTRA